MFYRDRHGELCEAVCFKSANPSFEGDALLCFNGGDLSWICDALGSKTLELSALGSALVLKFRGGSYGLAPGDYVIRKRGGEITHCRADRFEQEYEAVDG